MRRGRRETYLSCSVRHSDLRPLKLLHPVEPPRWSGDANRVTSRFPCWSQS